MPRDYRKAPAKRGAGTTGDGFLSFISGLSVGLLVAFAIFLYQYLAPVMKASEEPVSPVPARAKPPAEPVKAKVPEPTFDFYQILPSREVSLSEWVEEAPQESAPAPNEKGLFILQVGSFKTFEAADQTKAELALIGIDANIQRVVINGQDIRHRVRIGPYSDPAELEKARHSLLENKLNFMLLRLEEDEAQTATR